MTLMKKKVLFIFIAFKPVDLLLYISYDLQEITVIKHNRVKKFIKKKIQNFLRYLPFFSSKEKLTKY